MEGAARLSRAWNQRRRHSGRRADPLRVHQAASEFSRMIGGKLALIGCCGELQGSPTGKRGG